MEGGRRAGGASDGDEFEGAWRGAPVAVSQSRTVLSLEADASVVPSGEKTTELTEWLWPLRVCL